MRTRFPIACPSIINGRHWQPVFVFEQLACGSIQKGRAHAGIGCSNAHRKLFNRSTHFFLSFRFYCLHAAKASSLGSFTPDDDGSCSCCPCGSCNSGCEGSGHARSSSMLPIIA